MNFSQENIKKNIVTWILLGLAFIFNFIPVFGISILGYSAKSSVFNAISNIAVLILFIVPIVLFLLTVLEKVCDDTRFLVKFGFGIYGFTGVLFFSSVLGGIGFGSFLFLLIYALLVVWTLLVRYNYGANITETVMGLGGKIGESAKNLKNKPNEKAQAKVEEVKEVVEEKTEEKDQ